MSTANVNPTNIVLAPMRVSANGVDLGGTTNGVTLSIKTDHTDIMVDQLGKTVLDSKVLGHTFAFKFDLAESLDPLKWKQAFPHAKLVGTPGNQMIYFDDQVGDSLKAHAVAWVFHPLDKLDTDLSDDLKVFLAAAKSVSEIKYGPDKQTGIAVELQVFADFTTTPARFMIHGDPTIGVVNALAAAPVAGANTGNGTITSQVANNAHTVTETITVTFIGTNAAGAKLFKVSGSVSGFLGEYALAAANLSTVNVVVNPVSFTATQGSTAFVEGDSFTIAMTAANYS